MVTLIRIMAPRKRPEAKAAFFDRWLLITISPPEKCHRLLRSLNIFLSLFFLFTYWWLPIGSTWNWTYDPEVMTRELFGRTIPTQGIRDMGRSKYWMVVLIKSCWKLDYLEDPTAWPCCRPQRLGPGWQLRHHRGRKKRHRLPCICAQRRVQLREAPAHGG